MGEEVRGLRSSNRQLQYSHGYVKYSIGKGVAKEFTHMVWCGDRGSGVSWVEGERG